MDWRSEKRSLKDLIPATYNPRKISKKQMEDLSTSIERFSICDPIIINTDNTVIGGHQRIKALKARGVETVDVRVPERTLTKEEEKELNLRLNKNSGDWDEELLKNFENDMLVDVGFEISDIFKDEKGDKAEDCINNKLKSVFEIVIECDCEKEQQQVFERISKEGYRCRILTL